MHKEIVLSLRAIKIANNVKMCHYIKAKSRAKENGKAKDM